MICHVWFSIQVEAERAEMWKDEEDASRKLIAELQREENAQMDELVQQQRLHLPKKATTLLQQDDEKTV